MLYLVGGGYLTDLFDVESFILPVKLAGYFGVPVETAPLGIGPFNHPWNVKRLKDALADAKVRVRDVDSQRICRGCGIPAELRKDDGFRVSEVMEIQHGNAKTSPLIGVNFYHQHGGIDRDREATWWRELLLLLKTNGARIEGFCFHNSLPSDFSQTVQLFEAAGLPAKQVRFPDWDFRDACRRLTDYDVIVTSRFHAVVIAGALEIPAIAVANGEYYDSKMTAACEGQARSRAIDLNNMQPAQVAQFI
jgi:polysaccharide pyruvyl transferase WcaK-like protein